MIYAYHPGVQYVTGPKQHSNSPSDASQHEVAHLCAYAAATPWPKLHGPAHVGGFWRGQTEAKTGCRRKLLWNAKLRHRVLSCQCTAFKKAGGHRRSSVWKTAAGGLLFASSLVPISVRCHRDVLYSCAREDIGIVSGLAGNDDLPTILQKSRVALGSGRVSELA